MTGLEIGWLKYATRPRVMEEARRGGGRGERGEGERGEGGKEGEGRRQNAEIGMYPAGYSTMERIDSLFNYVFREVTSTATPTFQPPFPPLRPPLQPSSPISFPSLFIPMNLSTRRFGILTAS